MAGAALPDLPTPAKGAYLLRYNRDSRTKEEFLESLEYYTEPSGRLDLALHSLAPVGSMFALYKAVGLKKKTRRGLYSSFC